MATLYLIRHGQASFGSEDYDRLSPLGERQASALGDYLAAHDIHLDAAYSGDLLRQRETARLALASQPREVNYHIDPRFNEIRNDEQIRHLGPILARENPAVAALLDTGLKDSKGYQKIIEAVFKHWVSPQCDSAGIQSWAAYSEAVRSGLSELVRTQGSGKTVAVFTSGGTIATIVAQVLGMSGAQTYQFYEPVFNCSVTQLLYSGERISLSYFNDRTFLQMIGRQEGENLVSYR
jgi:broad specificity phosphatase PhoE